MFALAPTVNGKTITPWPTNEKVYISEHFTMQEAIKSDTASRRGIVNWPLAQGTIDNICFTARTVLEPIRNHFGIPFTPNSFYRGLELNTAVGSTEFSYHVKGLAVDIELPGIDNHTLAKWAQYNIAFDKIILENYELGNPHSGWVHIQVNFDKPNRKETLTFSKGQYYQGFQL